MDTLIFRGFFVIFFIYTFSTAQTTKFITSENYPDDYPSSFSRDYWFDVEGAENILITFRNFSLEYSFQCSADSLEVFYVQEKTYKFLAEYCGTWDIFSVVISSSKGAFRMTSDSTVERLGFRVEYSEIQADYDSIVNDTAGTVSSPRYYGKYPNNANHVITILNRNRSRIALKFLVFDIHATDLLEVQDGIAPTSPVLYKLSGTTLPDTMYGYGEGLRLHFRSDLHFTRAGYILNYTVEELRECQDTDNGTEYQGTMGTSALGTACMYWRNLEKSSEFHQLSENFCRNPDGRASPWCYTTPGVVENCSIDRCPYTDLSTVNTTLSNGMTPDIVKVVKSGESGQKESEVTPQTTSKTPVRNTAPAGKPDGTSDETSNAGETANSPKRNLLVPITVGGVSFFVAAMALLLIIAKRRQMRNRQSMRHSLEIHPIELPPIDEIDSGEVKYGRSKYHPNNIHIPSEEITYTAIDNIEVKSERSDSSTSDSRVAIDTTLKRFRDGKRLAMHFDEDGYGIVDGEAKDDFTIDDRRFALNRTREGDYDHLRSFKVKWRKADEETDALYDHCQVDVIRESKQSNVFDDTYDHTTTVMLNNDLKSDDQSASESNVYHDCVSEQVTSI